MEKKLFRTNENFKSVNWGINVVVPLLYEKPQYFVFFYILYCTQIGTVIIESAITTLFGRKLGYCWSDAMLGTSGHTV